MSPALRLRCALFAVCAVSSVAQTPKFAMWGYPLASGKDLSGDGVPDFATLIPAVAGPQVLEVRSGVDGSLLHSTSSTPPAVWSNLVVLGDVDADGDADLAVLEQTPAVYGPCPSGVNCPLISPLQNAVRIFHGGAWNETTVTPPGAANLPLTSLWAVGDVDDDGHADLAYGFPGTKSGGACFSFTTIPLQTTGGLLAVYSTGVGQLVRQHNGAQADPWPKEVFSVGDANGDGRDDYAATSDGIAGFTYYYGCESGIAFPASFPTVNASVRVYSGMTGATLSQRTFTPSRVVAAPVGDVNLDGVPDLVVAVTSANPVSPGAPNRAARFLAAWSAGGPAEHWSRFMFDAVGTGVAGGGQVDGVFGPDIYVSESVFPRARVRCLSGFDGTERFAVYARAEPTFYNFSLLGTSELRSVLPAGDLDGDGFGDFVAETHAPFDLAAKYYVYTSARTGVVERAPGCAALVPPTMVVSPAGTGFPAVVRGVGAPPYPAGGTLFASAPGAAQIPLAAGVIGALPCVIDLDPATVFALAPTVSEAQNLFGVRGPPSVAPIPPGFVVDDNLVPDRWSVSFDVPDLPALVGFTLRLQAVFYPPGGFSVSNSAELTIQDS